MKMPVSWYQTNLVNTRASIQRDEEHIKKLQQRLDRLKQETDFLQQQIDEATRRGMEAFDEGRFLVKRKK